MIGDGDNLIWGEIGSGSSDTASFILLQKEVWVDKFRVDHNGNITTAGNIISLVKLSVWKTALTALLPPATVTLANFAFCL